MPQDSSVVIGDLRFVVSPLALAIIKCIAQDYNRLEGKGQLVIDHDDNEFTPKHLEIGKKTKVV